MDQLEKQLDTEEIKEIGSMDLLDSEYVVMIRNYFLQYTQLEILEFRDTLIQHIESVKKSIDKRALLKREYDSWVNERQMQTTEEKDTSSRSGNDAHDDDADIRHIYDEEPMAEENETLKNHYKDLYDSIKVTRTKTIEQTTSLIAKNDEFKAQLQKKGFAIAALKNELRKLSGNSVNTKFAKQSILGKPVLQPHRNQSVVRQPTAFKSERPRISKPRFASQVDVNNDLSKPVTTYYLPKGKESACVKPHHMITPGSSRYNSNDMVHNHYLEEAKEQTQESDRNLRPSVMPPAKSQQAQTNAFLDADHVGYVDTRKSTSRGIQFLGDKLVSWMSKKQDCTAMSSAVAEYVALSAIMNEYKGTMPNKMELTLEQSQQGVSNDVLAIFILINGEPWLYSGGGIPFQLKSDSLPHAHAQTTKTCYKHQHSRIKKAQDSKTKTSANSDIRDPPSRYQVYQGRLLASFQDDASMSMLVKTQDRKAAKMIKTEG
ncbi:hypothetical protein Tco_1338022 [Tanacetum coccineum]